MVQRIVHHTGGWHLESGYGNWIQDRMVVDIQGSASLPNPVEDRSGTWCEVTYKVRCPKNHKLFRRITCPGLRDITLSRESINEVWWGLLSTVILLNFANSYLHQFQMSKMGKQQPTEEYVPFLPQDDGYSEDLQETQVFTIIQQTFRARFYIVNSILLILNAGCYW